MSAPSASWKALKSAIDEVPTPQTNRYNQIQFSPSPYLVSFCMHQIVKKYDLSEQVVLSMYTAEQEDLSVYRKLNRSLCNLSENHQPVVIMVFARLLNQYIWNQLINIHDDPLTVYRGMRLDDRARQQFHVDLYKNAVGKTIYWYSFTSTSTSLDIATSDNFCNKFGIVFKIALHRGKRNCCMFTAVIPGSQHSQEKEVLIGSNAGFSIVKVSFFQHPSKGHRLPLITLTMVDESNCRGGGCACDIAIAKEEKQKKESGCIIS